MSRQLEFDDVVHMQAEPVYSVKADLVSLMIRGCDRVVRLAFKTRAALKKELAR